MACTRRALTIAQPLCSGKEVGVPAPLARLVSCGEGQRLPGTNVSGICGARVIFYLASRSQILIVTRSV